MGSIGGKVDAIMEALRMAKSMGCSVWPMPGMPARMSAHRAKTARKTASRREKEPPFAPHKANELRPQPPREHGRRDGKGDEDDRGSRARAEGNLGAADKPYGESEHEHAQGLREPEAPVFQRRKERVGEGEDQQAQRLDGHEPENCLRHGSTFGLGTGRGVAEPCRVITGCR